MNRLSRRRDAMARTPSLEITRTANKRYENALDNRTYLLVNKPSEDEENVAKTMEKWVKRLQTHMKSHMFHAFDPVSVISY